MPTAKDILRIARSQLGTSERSDGWTKYGAAYEDRKHVRGFARAAWCDMFVGWCAVQAGALSIVGDFAYTPSHAQWFADRGRWGHKPRVGAIIFFDWSGSHSRPAIDHVGIVEAVRADGSVVTLEGNTDNAVRRRVRRSGIAGYGYPAYSTGSRPPSKPDKPKPGTAAPRWPGRYITQPPATSGNDVRTWQRQMRARGWHLAVDGVYGPASEKVARAFQKEKRLQQDGVIGPATWAAAWTAPLT
ncbi:CHAP domain-containing protein [Actinomadura rudentiformis]|uniref:CHAP domain-containing protein n=1 Tax=Actinomadura rudentiformis TaxID=359158 RepID=A0A6H9YGS1_9ACTN|nr:CHAP domain-containing protein [Actinomadura rudentiformis]KAB2344894.1 CHAP domain-containing protein [Actinomadura rudentiformis]